MESPQSLENLQPFGCPNFIKKSRHLLGGPSPAEEGRPLEAPPAGVLAGGAVPPPREDRRGGEKAEEVLVGKQGPQVEEGGLILGRSERIEAVGEEGARVIAGGDHADLLRREAVAPDDAPPSAFRIGHYDPGGPEDPGDEVAEVVLLARVFTGEKEWQNVVDDGDLGDPEPQDPLGDRVEQKAEAIGPRPEPQDGLKPRQAHDVPEKTA